MISIIIGIGLLYFGAEGLVRGSSRLAARFGISPLVIGLTVVAFGTSSPELLVSLSAAIQGANEVAVGNVVGSNIFNVAVILGLTGLIRPGSGVGWNRLHKPQRLLRPWQMDGRERAAAH